MNIDALHEELFDALKAAANPAKAPQMQAYMKSELPFFGVPNPVMKKVCREVFKRHVPASKREWLRAAESLWQRTTHREEWYAALEWTGLRVAKPWQDAEVLPLYEDFIVSSAWWDTVDLIAVHRVGPLLRAEPKVLRPILTRWSKDENLWRRRTAILSQLDFKEDTDLEFLFAMMKPSLERKEFWLRKAIGWALRQQARVHPDEVRAYVKAHEDVLSGLSKREALKHL